VECLATEVPEVIRVNISELRLGNIIHVRELQLPEGVKVLDPPDAIVVQVKAVTAEPVVTPTEMTGAEPEVITARKKEETEE
jgi:large subunit ribosomal protein L25